MVQARSAIRSSLSHEERTATEPRDKDLYPVILNSIESVNEKIRLFRLAIKDQRSVKFLPGQWLDVHVPGLTKAGGFTITSTPRDALPQSSEPEPNQLHSPFLELAVQESPSNPPAAWLWRPSEEILGKEFQVRIGGSFVWPPPGVNLDEIHRVIFIAGGVGINPLISILSHIHQTNVPLDHVRFLYATRIPRYQPKITEILFLSRLSSIFQSFGLKNYRQDEEERGRLELYLTGGYARHPISLNVSKNSVDEKEDLEVENATSYTYFRRIKDDDLQSAVGFDKQARESSLYYVCGPPEMTDYIVEHIRKQDSVDPERVLCEKWW
ncbi:uncharacterized protein K441DRAFT_647580 [Cenococcum geophilum 1.58]|uniref:Uncharacterized protein n=1 Tax=Cenococcum geophilum 1.58 TaxID=794803 RepID=A0ACC8ENL9_9PEZI|nr:hypothetical protein K441DRAFT_647580 [Cenococcum geophilum 1.58]